MEAAALAIAPTAHTRNMNIPESGINVFIVAQVPLDHVLTVLQENTSMSLVQESVVIAARLLMGHVQLALQGNMNIS